MARNRPALARGFYGVAFLLPPSEVGAVYCALPMVLRGQAGEQHHALEDAEVELHSRCLAQPSITVQALAFQYRFAELLAASCRQRPGGN